MQRHIAAVSNCAIPNTFNPIGMFVHDYDGEGLITLKKRRAAFGVVESSVETQPVKKTAHNRMRAGSMFQTLNVSIFMS